MHILPKYISTHFFNNCCQNVSITTKRIKELYSEFIKLILISLPTLCVWIKKTNFLLARTTNLCRGRSSLAKLREVSFVNQALNRVRMFVFENCILGEFSELV